MPNSGVGASGSKAAPVAPTGGGTSATAPAASAASAAAAAPPKAKKFVVYDPLTAAFPPGSSSLARKVVGRAPLFALPFTPAWRRASELMHEHAQLAADKRAERRGSQKLPASVNEEKKDDATPVAASRTIVAAPSVFSSSTHEDNVVAGPLGDAHVLAALVSLSAHPNRLARLFPALDDAALGAVAHVPAPGKNTHIAGLVTASKLKSSAIAKVYLAESRDKFEQEIKDNKYRVRLFYGGLWQIFTVDDFIPVTQADEGAGGGVDGGGEQDLAHLQPQGSPGLPLPLFTQCRDCSEFWMLLLEKALAKALGSYEDLCCATPVQITRMITGGSADTIVLPAPTPPSDKISAVAAAATAAAPHEGRDESDKVWSHVLACWHRSDLLSCSTRELTASQQHSVRQSAVLRGTRAAAAHSGDGSESALHHFLHDHAELGIRSFFTILDVVELPAAVGGARLVLLRNPQGSQHYDGRWSDHSEEWKNLDACLPDGPLHVTRLQLSRRKHSMAAAAKNASATSSFASLAPSPTAAASAAAARAASAAGGAGSGGPAVNNDGIFWMCWSDVLAHFAAIFVTAVLPDQFDICQTMLGAWKGKTAAGRPPELEGLGGAAGVTAGAGGAQALQAAAAAAAAATGPLGFFLNNPAFRIRNTAAKKSSPIVLTLSRGTNLCNMATSAIAAANSNSTDTPPAAVAAASSSSSSSSALRISTSSSASASSSSSTPGVVKSASLFGFKIVSNQLSHSLNSNAAVSSPWFGVLGPGPLHDDFVVSPLSRDTSLSVTVPALPPYVDYYFVPFLWDSGEHGDFVVNLWTSSQSILFDACASFVPPCPNVLEVPVGWSRRDGSSGGSVWADNGSYLANPTFRVTSLAPADAPPSKLLFLLSKTRRQDIDVQTNMRLLENKVPSVLAMSAVGCVFAPAKSTGAGAGAAAGPGPGPGPKRPTALLEPLDPSVAAAASATLAAASSSSASSSSTAMVSPARKGGASSSKLQPVQGTLSPFHECVEGCCTRSGEQGLYQGGRALAMVCSCVVPGRDYYLVCSTSQPGTEAQALLQLYGTNLDLLKVERVFGGGSVPPPGTPGFSRVIAGRWAGVNAAGPARRKRTFLNNPQFCVRHQGVSAISIVVSLLYTGPVGSGAGNGFGSAGLHGHPGTASNANANAAEASVNISFCTFPTGSADPNPFTSAEKEEEKRKQKDASKKSLAAEEARRRKAEADKKVVAQAQANLVRGTISANETSTANANASASAASSLLSLPTGSAGAGAAAGVASLRIKSKDRGSLKKNRSSFGAGGGGGGGGDAGDADVPTNSDEDAVARVAALTTDYELLAQTTYNGDLYKSGRLFHLFVGDVAPDHSYYLIPSTSVPGFEGDFSIQVFGASETVDLKLEPCVLNAAGDAVGQCSTRSSFTPRACLAFTVRALSHVHGCFASVVLCCAVLVRSIGHGLASSICRSDRQSRECRGIAQEEGPCAWRDAFSQAETQASSIDTACTRSILA